MKKREGICHICGEHKVLTYEHVPPRAALNNAKARVYSGVDIVQQQQNKISPDTTGLRYQDLQRGTGGYTLCAECNNNTGAFYAPHYNEFVTMMYELLQDEYPEWRNHKTPAGGPYTTINVVSKPINGLAIFKQMIAMFCSTFRSDGYQYEFRDFLLNKNSTDFDRERWGVSIYINTGLRCGSSGLSTFFSTDGETFDFAEIITIPIGIVLYDRKSAIMKNTRIDPHFFGCNITGFSQQPYDTLLNFGLELPLNYGARFMPGFK